MECEIINNGKELWSGVMTAVELFTYVAENKLVSAEFSLDYFAYTIPNTLGNFSITCWKG